MRRTFVCLWVLALVAPLVAPGPSAAQSGLPDSVVAPTPPTHAPPSVVPAPAAPIATPPAPALSDTTSRRFRWSAKGGGRIVLEKGERVTIAEGGVRVESDTTTIESRRARVYRERELAFFYEDVVVHDGNVVMTGDEGEFSRPRDYAELRGRVKIRDPHGTILADRARYLRGSGILRLWGHVDFQDPKTRVQADSVVYRERDGIGDAFGNVVLTDVESGSEAHGPRAIYDRTTGEAHLVSRPKLALREKGAEETEVEADDIQMDRDKTVVQTRGDVRIRRGKTYASADSAFLYRQRDLAELRGHPRVRQEETRMVGREIDVHYEGNAVKRVDVRHDAQIIQARADTLLIPEPNVVRGDSAVLFFEAGELERAIVRGHATSFYVPRETRPNRISTNEAQADSIVMLFSGKDVQEVVFTGAASGTYRFFEGNLDSLRAPKTAQFDTTFGVVRGDTTRFDFHQRAEVVEYSAERILYLEKQNDLLLQNAAQVDYQNRTLRAGRIRYDADTDLLDATDRPVLDDSGDRMYGDRMGYEMNTRKAWVRDASTTFDQGYYTGHVLRKEPDGTLQVASGSYTTCDLAHPHYRFESNQMKLYLNDKVVARPVWVYIGNVKVGWLPFIVNSASTKRRSGFLQPYFEFGVFSSQRYIRGLDYYWAASRYFDLLFSGDYTDRERPNRSTVQSVLATSQDTRSVGLSIHSRYKWLYHFDGNLDFRRTQNLGPGQRFWTLDGNHDQPVGEHGSLRGNFHYVSSDQALQQNFDNRDFERSLQRQLTSGLSFSRPSDLASFSINLRRVQQLNPGARFVGTTVSHVLPSVNATFRQIRLGPAPRDPEHPGAFGWLNDLRLTPGFAFSRQTSENRAVRDTTTIPPGGVPLADSFVVLNNELITASTGAGLNRRFNMLFLNITPSVNYSLNYVDDSTQPDSVQHWSHQVRTGVQGSTTFYGTFHPKHWRLNALRHVLDLNAALNYSPEISGQQKRSTTMSLGARNKIDVKIQDGEELKRLDSVVEWSLATTYNPTTLGGPGQPDRKFGTITSFLALNPSPPLRISIAQTYDPYTGKITSTSVPFNVRLSGRFGYGDTGTREAERNRVVQEEGASATPPDTSAVPGRPRGSDKPDPLEGVEPVQVGRDGSLSWDLGMGYSLSRVNGVTQSARIGLALTVQPTRNWSVQYRASYDGRLHTLGKPEELRITRDLHCWKASFSRYHTDVEYRYYLRIWVAKHEQDLFLENGDRSLGY